MLTHDDFDFSFDPSACETCGARCCIGESGLVIISDDEVTRLAEELGISVQKMHRRYITATSQGVSLREIKLDDHRYACVFLDLEKKRCSVYDARPDQCRTFPFWDEYFLKKDSTFHNCPGILPQW